MIAAVAYFSMGANLGWTGILVEFQRSNPKVSGNIRQIFYVRYIDCKCSCLAFGVLLSGTNSARVPYNTVVTPRPSLDLRTSNTYYCLHNLTQ